MAAFRTYAFCMLLLHALAVAVTSSAKSTAGLVQSAQTIDDGPEYTIDITYDEERRLVELLGPEYLEVGLIGTHVTGPPRECPVCGKQTEFIDWVFTALARGIHSPEFIVESLKLGHSPKKLGHDVYCSRCGHLTHFRDASGAEGGAPYIALAPPYDRDSRTFGKSVYKRDVEDAEAGAADGDPAPPPVWRPLWTKRDEDHIATAASDDESPAPPPVWRPLWTKKREDDVESLSDEESPAPPPVWRPLWTKKREDDITPPAWRPLWTKTREEAAENIAVSDDESPAPPPVWRPLWTKKREESVESVSNEGSPAPPPVWRPLWTKKREDEVVSADESLAEGAEPVLPPVWRPLWTKKREDGAGPVPDEKSPAPPPVWRPLWTKKRDDDLTPPAWRPLWTKRHSDNIEITYEAASYNSEPAPPPVWRPLWTKKREDGITPPAWRPLWTKKREDDANPIADKETPAPPPVWRPLWTKKRDE